MKAITVRGIDEETSALLRKRAKAEGTSVNALTLRILRESLGSQKRKRTAEFHDLDHLAGTWSKEDVKEFEKHTAFFEKVDEELWI